MSTVPPASAFAHVSSSSTQVWQRVEQMSDAADRTDRLRSCAADAISPVARLHEPRSRPGDRRPGVPAAGNGPCRRPACDARPRRRGARSPRRWKSAEPKRRSARLSAMFRVRVGSCMVTLISGRSPGVPEATMQYLAVWRVAALDPVGPGVVAHDPVPRDGVVRVVGRPRHVRLGVVHHRARDRIAQRGAAERRQVDGAGDVTRVVGSAGGVAEVRVVQAHGGRPAVHEPHERGLVARHRPGKGDAAVGRAAHHESEDRLPVGDLVAGRQADARSCLRPRPGRPGSRRGGPRSRARARRAAS